MCGIVGYCGTEKAAPFILEGLQMLEYRGYDSSGLVIMNHAGAISRVRAVGHVASLRSKATEQLGLLDGVVGIGHTRWATHGKPTKENAHPHIDCKAAFALVHNGIIENFSTLKAQLASHTFTSETDTEVVAHLLEREYGNTGSVLESFRNALTQLRGAYALVVVSVHEPETLYFAKQGSPLVVGEKNGEYYVASDTLPLAGRVDCCYYLKDGEWGSVSRAHGIKIFDSSGGEVTNVLFSSLSDEKHNDGELKGYAHYMEKEFSEIPDVVRRAYLGRLTESGLVDLTNAGFTSGEKPALIRLVACGTSYHAALLGKTFFESVARIPTEVELASEFRYRTYVPRDGELLVAVSQSGETADTLAAVKKAKECGISTAAVVNVAQSSIAREVERVLYCNAGREISVASTKACISQSIVLALLALVWSIDPVSKESFTKSIRTLPECLERVLLMRSQIETIAEDIAERSHVFCLGRGGECAVAYETALKLKEVAYVFAEGYPSGELKHGSLALIDSSVPTIAYVSSESVHAEKMNSNIAEVRARGGKVYAFAPIKSDCSADTLVSVPQTHSLLQPLVHILASYIVAYRVGVVRGASIDKPRNLAKAVTVE